LYLLDISLGWCAPSASRRLRHFRHEETEAQHLEAEIMKQPQKRRRNPVLNAKGKLKSKRGRPKGDFFTDAEMEELATALSYTMCRIFLRRYAPADLRGPFEKPIEKLQ
jgi:hypothetical protein